ILRPPPRSTLSSSSAASDVYKRQLRTHAAYVGAMGSRRTHSDRLARLRDIGLTDAELAGLASPIGLDIGARTPKETADSIAAEITQHRWGGTGRPLTETAGEIHRDRLVAP